MLYAFDPFSICVVCGTIGAYNTMGDFSMGDFYCMSCLLDECYPIEAYNIINLLNGNIKRKNNAHTNSV